MRATCPRSPLVGTGWLEGWRLTFGGADLGWESAVATVVEAPGERVFVSLYDLDPADRQVLDELEGFNSKLYRKMHSQAATLEANRPVWLYVFEGFEGGLPSQWYLDEILRAAEAAGAPQDYVEALRKRPTAELPQLGVTAAQDPCRPDRIRFGQGRFGCPFCPDPPFTFATPATVSHPVGTVENGGPPMSDSPRTLRSRFARTAARTRQRGGRFAPAPLCLCL